ncbi:MAG: 4Fe-4S binding protein [Spirochaetes bacterium]|nr:4Fe-4S binding protein [Spirochaetota bacterium]
MGRGVRNFNDSTPSSRNNEYYDTNFRESGYRQEEQRQTDPQTLSREQSLNEANQLKEQAERLKEELNNIHKKINTLNSKKKNTEPKLTVDKSLCTACGICRDLCPRKAITVRDFAEIDQNLCTLCGRCVSQCPAGALQIQ